MKKLGKQYKHDDDFKRRARLHQSLFRRNVFGVDCDEYGNRLLDADAKNLLNYYDQLNVRDTLRERYPNYSRRRDADMLRSEHIPFNFFAPLKLDFLFAKELISNVLGVPIQEIKRIEIEYAPQPKTDYLNDNTAFDAYIEFIAPNDNRCGIGIEVKYTEKAYPIGKREKVNVSDKNSQYWTLTTGSGLFDLASVHRLIDDDLRQIWRNHLLGLSMLTHGDLDEFLSVLLFPSGNRHFVNAISAYKSIMTKTAQNTMYGLTFEEYIASIDESVPEIKNWKDYLYKRYIVQDA